MILAERDLHPSEPLQNYVGLAGHALVYSAEEVRWPFAGYRFAVLAGEEPFSLSLPGGYVFVSAGLLKVLRDEDELAAVLAHEIAHVSLRHALELVEEALGGRGLGSLSAVLPEVARALDAHAYGRARELAADRAAFSYLEAAGYDPQALRDLLEASARGKRMVLGGNPADFRLRLSALEPAPPAGDGTARAEARRQRRERYLRAVRGALGR